MPVCIASFHGCRAKSWCRLTRQLGKVSIRFQGPVISVVEFPRVLLRVVVPPTSNDVECYPGLRGGEEIPALLLEVSLKCHSVRRRRASVEGRHFPRGKQVPPRGQTKHDLLASFFEEYSMWYTTDGTSVCSCVVLKRGDSSLNMTIVTPTKKRGKF